MKHLSWDQGVLEAGFRDLNLPYPLQKTSKTLCGRRVAVSQIDNQAATCPHCQAELERKDRENAAFMEFLRAEQPEIYAQVTAPRLTAEERLLRALFGEDLTDEEREVIVND